MTDNKDYPEDPRDLTPEQRKNIKIEFAPGCFDEFDGSQEELDELLANIQNMIETGEIFENSRALDMDELMEEDPEFALMLMEKLNGVSEEDLAQDRNRKLN